VAAACRTLELSRSNYYRSGRSSLKSRSSRKEMLKLSAQHARYGYRRITVLMRRDGFEVKRTARIRREEGISVSKKRRRMKRLGILGAQRQQAERPCQVWSWDFVGPSVAPCDRVEHDHQRAIEECNPPYAITMNWASPRTVLESVGLFNELFLRGCDSECARRVAATGYRLVSQREAVIYHRNEITQHGLFSRRP
jgi:hypothetical protein